MSSAVCARSKFFKAASGSSSDRSLSLLPTTDIPTSIGEKELPSPLCWISDQSDSI
ncbi:hypothetical protein DPMN_076250 [Dreissena polymorpha]|uniref:Uncharacterized protein n=1 Tax=Dreissena polymorpha TaxID=45954 RepID=A0A9D4BQB9_DREPO|nr:hypothetical protein DPMN_076250 [Dreissena polymorpha]